MAPPLALETDPGLTDRIAARIRKRGHTRKRAAELEGVSERSASRWYGIGKRLEVEERQPADADEARYLAFTKAMDRAEAQWLDREARRLDIAIKKAKDPAGAIMKRLARRFPAEWGRQDNAEAPDFEGQAADAAKVRDTVVSRLIALLPKKEGPPDGQPPSA